MKHLFPPNDKSHIIKTRNHEQFKVFKANTNRLQKSPMIYMQTSLNTAVRRISEEDNTSEPMWVLLYFTYL